MFEWNHICDGVEVQVSLSTNKTWVTHQEQKLYLKFTVRSGLGVTLDRIGIDPDYINVTESPSANISGQDTWSAEWCFTPKAEDETLRRLGLQRGGQIDYYIALEVAYTTWGGGRQCVLQIYRPKPSVQVVIRAAD